MGQIIPITKIQSVIGFSICIHENNKNIRAKNESYNFFGNQ